MPIAPPSPPFIGARHHGGAQTPKAIVMHGTVSPCDRGRARSIASWWHGSTSPVTSAHYVRDPYETIQCVGDHTVAYHCGYNDGSIGYELCDPETGPASRWSDGPHTLVLAGAAEDVARLCLAYGIEIRRPSIAELKAKGPHGIYSHNDSRLAFGHTTHTDPIGFPWDAFIRQVKAAADRLAGAPDPRKPTPAPTPPEEDDMTPDQMLDAPLTISLDTGKKRETTLRRLLDNMQRNQDAGNNTRNEQYKDLSDRLDALTELLQQAIDSGKSAGA